MPYMVNLTSLLPVDRVVNFFQRFQFINVKKVQEEYHSYRTTVIPMYPLSYYAPLQSFFLFFNS